MVEAYQASGLSVPRFATLHGVNYQTLVSLIKKAKEPASAKHSPSPNPAFFSLVPAEVGEAFTTGTGRAMEVLLSSGTKIIITSSDQLIWSAPES